MEEPKSLGERNIETLEMLKAVEKKTEKKDAIDLATQLSIRDRLMRRAEKTTFETVFQDDLGDFAVETRLMTSSERVRALKLNQMLGQGQEDLNKYEDAINGLKELAAEICVTPGVDEYLKSDNVSDDVVVAMVIRTVYGTLETVGESITSFRKK